MPPKHAREFPRAVFLPFPESLKYTAVPIGFLLSPYCMVGEERGHKKPRPIGGKGLVNGA